MLDRVTRGRGDRAIRYSMVSVVGVVSTQLVLIVCYAGLGMAAEAANVVAVSLTAAPAFFLNKHWVWGKRGRAHLRREVLPFWGFALAGLLLSTIAVAAVDEWTDSTLLVSAANIGAFGLLWVAKFLFLDGVLFGRE
jgi:putative flippase GtrA